MPTATFKTTSSCPSCPSRKSDEVVTAAIVKYLAYADQTDLFGYHGVIEDVTVAPGNDSAVIRWRAPVSSRDDIRALNSEMEHMSHVRDHVCETNPNI